ncbi:hypothetical protein ACLB2K_063128 [Fragaria x ananassa]
MDRERSSGLRLQIHALHRSFGEHRSPSTDTSSPSPAWFFFFIAVQVFDRLLLFKLSTHIDEDEKLIEVVALHGLNQSGKSCRLRWVNHLRPNIKRGNMSEQEEDLIISLHKFLGTIQLPAVDEKPSVADNDQKVHVEMK